MSYTCNNIASKMCYVLKYAILRKLLKKRYFKFPLSQYESIFVVTQKYNQMSGIIFNKELTVVKEK